MSRSHTSVRVSLVGAVAALSLAVAAPAMAHPTLPSGHKNQQSAVQQSTQHQVLPSGHQTQQTPVQQQAVVATDGRSTSDGYGWNDLVTVAAAALLGAGITLGAMTLWRRHDQPLST
jgi:hypothetical protein